MSLIQHDIAFSESETREMNSFRNVIKSKLEKMGIPEETTDGIVVQLSFDDEENLRWGNVYIPVGNLTESAEASVWEAVHMIVSQYSSLKGFPESLIVIRPV